MDGGPTTVAALTRHRSGLVAALLGNAVEWYDFALFGGFAAVFATVLAPGGWAGFITVFAVFATSCLLRPLGSLLMGLRADRSGRRRALAATIMIMALATAGIALIPPWSAIGVLAPLALLALRGVQAFSVGGEIGVSVAYISEHSRAGRRGRAAGWYVSTVAAGLAVGVAVVMVTIAALDHDELLEWGWRIPFLVALPLGVIGVLMRRRLPESPSFVRLPGLRPLQVLSGYRGAVVRSFLVTASYSAVFNVWFVFLPGFLAARRSVPLSTALLAALAGLVVVVVVAPSFGRLSDRLGQRPMLLGAATTLAVVVVPAYLWMLGGSVPALLAGNLAIALLLAAFVLPAYLAGQFPQSVRATGLGLGYGISSALIGGTAPLLASIAVRTTDIGMPLYLSALALLGALAVLRSPAGGVEQTDAAREYVGPADRPLVDRSPA